MPDFTGTPDDGSLDGFLAHLLNGASPASFGRPADLGRLLSRRTHEMVGQAVRFAAAHGHTEVDALHLLHVLVSQSPVSDAVRALGADPVALGEALEEQLPGSTPAVSAPPALTASAQRALFEGAQIARAFGASAAAPEHVFFAITANQESAAGRLLAAAGVTPSSLQELAAERARSGGPDAAPASASATPTLDRFGVDLTAKARAGGLDPVIGRDDEVTETVEILLRRTKNNPVLIGEPGVGKTAIVEGLAQRIADGAVPELLRDRRLVALDLAGMVAGTRFRGDFEERVTKLIDEVVAHRDEVILFIDELHAVVGAGGGGESGTDAGTMLKPRLARGDLHLIGATTLAEYRRIEKDAALERRFQTVSVAEPSEADAVRILDGLKGRYEAHHGVQYTDRAIVAAVELSARYVTDRHLPDKAIDLIDQAGARNRLAQPARKDTTKLRARLADREAEKAGAISEERYEDASTLRDEIDRLKARIREGEAAPTRNTTVDEADIAAVLSRATGIPAARLTQHDRSRLAHLESELHQRVIGQEQAVAAIARAVRRSRSGMGDPRRPVGSFLFLGPTGVGKTELAKALAGSLFGDPSAMIRFDMSEFGERHTVSRLVGAPPGYVGYDEAGQLTERVRRNPYSVILLDEIEKAHPDVFNLLLQVLDDGRLTDGQGRTVDFRNTVVIMTSNLGGDVLASRSGALGFVAGADASGYSSDDDVRARVWSRLREAMRPEFLNRIDEVVFFRRLTPEQLQRITRLLLADTAARVEHQGVALELSDQAVAWLAEHGFEPEYGARPLRRLIQREVEDRIADLLIEGASPAGGRIRLDADADGIRVTRVAALMAA